MTVEREFLLNLLRASLLGETGFAVPETVNWSVLIDEANRQNVSVIASDGLQKLFDAGLYTVSGDREERRLKARWFSKTLKYEKRYADQVAAAKKMGERFASTGIQTVILKGFTVSECYPVPAHRYSADLDCFLIKDGEHLEAYELGNQVMEELGVKVGRGYYKNSSFDIFRQSIAPLWIFPASSAILSASSLIADALDKSFIALRFSISVATNMSTCRAVPIMSDTARAALIV